MKKGMFRQREDKENNHVDGNANIEIMDSIIIIEKIVKTY